MLCSNIISLNDASKLTYHQGNVYYCLFLFRWDS